MGLHRRSPESAPRFIVATPASEDDTAPTKKAYHVSIDGKGYILADESYAVQPQRPFNPRFSTGDPGFGDLSFWQFLTQENFNALGQDNFSVITKYSRSNGWDTRTGKPKLSQTSALFTPTAALSAFSGPTGVVPVVLVFNNDIYIVYPTGAAAFTRTTIQTRNVASNLPQIYHVNAVGGCIMSRDGDVGGKNTYIAFCTDNTIKFYDQTFTQVVSQTSATITSFQGIRRLSSTKFMAWGTVADNDGLGVIERWTFTATTHNIADTQVITLDGGFEGFLSPYAAVDSDATWYFVASDFTAAALRAPSKIIRITSTDITATNPTVSEFYFPTNVLVRGMVDVNGSAYYFGAENIGGDFFDVIYKFPSTLVYRSKKAKTGSNPNIGITSVFSRPDGLLFLSEDDLGPYVSMFYMDLSSNVSEVCAFGTAFSTTAVDLRPIFEYHGRHYMGRDAGQFSRTALARGVLPDTGDYMRLESSKYGANTQLIAKSLYSAKLELSAAIPADRELLIDVNGKNIGKIVKADGLTKEVVLTSELTGTSFQVVLRAHRSMDWTGQVERLTLRYIPTQFKKLSWSFVVRLDMALQLLNGQREQRSPQERFQNLKDAWSSNIPVVFADLDGKEYKALVTDFKGRVPLIDDDRDDREYLCPVELLEA